MLTARRAQYIATSPDDILTDGLKKMKEELGQKGRNGIKRPSEVPRPESRMVFSPWSVGNTRPNEIDQVSMCEVAKWIMVQAAWKNYPYLLELARWEYFVLCATL